MYVLTDLWQGSVRPSERGYLDGSEYDHITKQTIESTEVFRKELSPAGKKAFSDYEGFLADLSEISECDSFIRGFRLGARIILDVIGDYASPMVQVNEMGHPLNSSYKAKNANTESE